MTPLASLVAFARDRAGATAVTFAMFALPSIIAVGAAIDLGRAQVAAVRLEQTLDSAALAMAGQPGASDSELLAIANAYVGANFAPALGRVHDVEFEENVAAGRLNLTAGATIDSSFLHLIGLPTLTVWRASEVRRAESALMVALVLDNTGSMWSRQNGVANIESLRQASRTLVNQLFGDETSNDNLRVAVIPYAAAVNVGSAASGIVNGGHGLGDPTSSDLLGWKGCVLERSGANSIADTAPATARWEPFRYPSAEDNQWLDPARPPEDDDDDDDDDGLVEGVIDLVTARLSIEPGGTSDSNGFRGPNLGCPTPIQPLTKRKRDVTDAIDAMRAWNRGGTLTDIGVAWGLRVLSPGAPFTESDANDPQTGLSLWESPRWRRAIVIMTDGESQFFTLSGTHPATNNPSPLGFVRPANVAVPVNTDSISNNNVSDFTGYGRLGEGLASSILNTSNAGTARDRLNQRIESLCTRAKQDNITVYTVVFTSGVGQAVRDMYQRCASDPGKYWYAPSQAALQTAFSQIGRDLARLHVSR